MAIESIYLKKGVSQGRLPDTAGCYGSCEDLIRQSQASCCVGIEDAVTVEVSGGGPINLFRAEAQVRVTLRLADPIRKLAVPVHRHGSHAHIAETRDLQSSSGSIEELFLKSNLKKVKTREKKNKKTQAH